MAVSARSNAAIMDTRSVRILCRSGNVTMRSGAPILSQRVVVRNY